MAHSLRVRARQHTDEKVVQLHLSQLMRDSSAVEPQNLALEAEVRSLLSQKFSPSRDGPG
jgi:hypothetical protein